LWAVVGLAITPSDTASVARRLFAAFEHGGTAALLDLLHPDVEMHPAILGAPSLHGRSEVREWLTKLQRAGGELEARPLAVEVVRGDFAIVRGYLRHRDGRTLAENQTHWLYEVRDGLVLRIESYPSHAAAVAAIPAA
jgi:ketosteroid isomerase-like protein